MSGHDNTFWWTVLGAVVVRLFTAEYEGALPSRLFRGGFIAFAAIFSAVTFTRPVVSFFDLPLDVWQIPVAALLALTGEGLMRIVIRATGDSKYFLSLIRAWKGGK